jgi:hypothetical protein
LFELFKGSVGDQISAMSFLIVARKRLLSFDRFGEWILDMELGCVSDHPKSIIRRRDVLGLAAASAVATVASAGASGPASAEQSSLKDKRRARYQANSPEVKNFYRVNRYPSQ